MYTEKNLWAVYFIAIDSFFMCDMTCLRATWLINVRHENFTYGTWLSHVYRKESLGSNLMPTWLFVYAQHVTQVTWLFVCVWHVLFMCDTTHECATWVASPSSSFSLLERADLLVFSPSDSLLLACLLSTWPGSMPSHCPGWNGCSTSIWRGGVSTRQQTFVGPLDNSDHSARLRVVTGREVASRCQH